MADEPNWQPAEAPPWAQQQEPNWQPAEAPSWAAETEKPAERSVLRRAVEAPIESVKESGRAIAKPFIPPKTKEEARERSSILGSAGETGGAILSAAGAIPGAILSPAQSLISSGLAAITPGPGTSEEKYQEWMPKVGTAFMGLGRAPTGAGAGRFPMPSPIMERVKRVPAKGPEAEAGRFIEEKATDPEAVRRALAAPDQEIVPGSQPTTFQLTGDPGLGQLERAAARRPDMVEEFKQRQGEQNLARSQAFEGIEGEGSPAAVSQHLRDQMNATNAANERAIQTAEQQAFEAEQRLGPAYDATTMGERFRREIEIAEAAERDREGMIWRRVDPDGTLVADPRAIQELERTIYSPARMTETARVGVTPVENRLSLLIQNYGNYIPFRELTDLRSLVSTAMREERMARGASTGTFQRLLQLRQGVEDALVTSVADVQPAGVARGAGAIGAQERVREASTATRERAEKFNPLRPITRSEMAGGPYKLGPSAVPGKIVQPGAKGYDSASSYLRAVGNETGMATVQDELIRRMRTEVFDRAGTPQQAQNRLEGFFRRYGDAFRAIDERDGGAFSQQLRSAGGAQDAVAAATARQRTAETAQSTDQFRQLTGAVDDADVARIIGGVMGKVDSQGRARALMSRLRGNPAAEEGARRAVVMHMRERLTSDVLSSDTPAMRAQAFQKYVRFNRPALAEILRPEQITTLETIAADLLRETRTNQTKAVGGGSDTVQNWLAEQQQQGKFRQAAGRIFTPLVRRVAAHWAASTLGGPAASVGLAAVEGVAEAGKLAKVAKRAERIKLIQEMVDEAMLKPEKAREYLGKTHRYKARTPGARAIVGYEAGAAEKQRQQLSPRAEGGAVPATGGGGGRSQGEGTPAAARQARPGPSKAVPDGGAARQQEADPWGLFTNAPNDPHGLLSSPPQYEGDRQYEPTAPGGTFYREYREYPTDKVEATNADPRMAIIGNRMPPPRGDVVYADGGEVGGARERWAAALAGSVTGAGQPGKAAKAPTGVQRQDIIDTLRRHGISGSEWADARTTVDSRADGGGVDLTPPPPPDPVPPPEPPPDTTVNEDAIPGTEGGFTDMLPVDEQQRRRQGGLGLYQDGGEVEDEKLPTPGGESRALERQPEPLPVLRRNQAGESLPGFIARAWGKGAADWAMTPGRAYKEGLTPEEETSWGAGTAMSMMGTGVPMATPGAAGIFGGRIAAAADLNALRSAERMHAHGVDPVDIWRQTGWFKGAEGKWRFEMMDPDQILDFGAARTFRTGQGGVPEREVQAFTGRLGDIVEHPAYWRNFPQNRDITANLFVDPAAQAVGVGRFRGAFHPDRREIRLIGSSPENLQSALLHEMQHPVQFSEGFAPGSNPTAAAQLVGPRRLDAVAETYAADRGLQWSALPPKAKIPFRQEAANDAYLLQAGEVEPRNVQRRWERKLYELPPMWTEDVPRNRQLVPTGQKRKRYRFGEEFGETPLQLAEGGDVEGGHDEHDEAPRTADLPPPDLPPALMNAWAATQPDRGPPSFRVKKLAREGLERAGEFVIPQTPTEIGLTAALGAPGRMVGMAGKAAMVAIGALMDAYPAYAGKIKTLAEMGVDTKTISNIVKQTLEHGGGTFSLRDGAAPAEGRMMGVMPNEENLVLPSGQNVTRKQIADFILSHEKELAGKERYLGTWKNPNTGETYVDISERFPAEKGRLATKFGERTGQLAGWDLGAGKEFPVGNWERFIQSGEYAKRLDEMAAHGRKINEASKYPDWWTDVPFREVYGERRMPQVAGYMASTAPNFAPKPNIQLATEYLRRSIKGEPVVQPEWRMPADAMSWAEGGMNPMEASRVPNLLKAERGDLELLQRNKVRDEASALMGDPRASVIDRHHVRLSEKPSEGIYASVKEGAIASRPLAGGRLNDYEKLQYVMDRQAIDSGLDPRTWSAHVWAGIRDTIQKTDQLYGQKYRGSAIPGESYSYAEQFEQVMDAKARHLNISTDKLKKLLGSGDQSLLTWIVATVPAAGAAYQQWSAGPEDRTAPASTGTAARNQLGL